MSYPKMKKEVYDNIGGINQKASVYKVGEQEVVGLVNFDFSEPGAWTKRWGFTNTLHSGNTLTIGASSTLNDMWQVFRNNTFDATPPSITPRLAFLFGHSEGVFKTTGSVDFSTGGTTFTYSPLLSGYSASNWNHAIYQDQSFFAARAFNGGQIYKYRPPFNASSTDAAFFFGMDIPPVASGAGLTAVTTAGTSFSGTYAYQYAYVDTFGFYGPLSGTFVFSTAGANTIVMSGFTLNNSASYGYSQTAIFRNRVTGFASSDMVRIGLFTGATFTDQFGALGQPDPEIIDTPETDTAYTDTGKYFEIYGNRLFYTKDNSDGSNTNKIKYSELDQPQLVYPENEINVTNEGNQITGEKAFNQSLIVFLQKGVFRLTGDNPDNFNVQQLVTEYGCISSKAIVAFKNLLWFLDEQGIVEFDGANFTLISNRVDDIFKSMNVTAASGYAQGLHVPERNEVWFAVPTGNNSINNIVVVYDYLANAWTTFTGTKLKPTSLAAMYREYVYENDTVRGSRIPKNRLYFFGSIGASLYNFHPSLQADDDGGITLGFTTRWHTEIGKSSTSEFRRFYLDTQISTGTSLVYSQTFGINFYANYVTLTPAYTAALNTSTLTQNRIDFGIPAKSLSAEVAYGSTTGVVKVFGYTVESRFLRSV